MLSRAPVKSDEQQGSMAGKEKERDRQECPCYQDDLNLGGAMVNKLDWQPFPSEFESNLIPHSYGLLSHL